MAGKKIIDPDMQKMLQLAGTYAGAYRDLESVVGEFEDQIAVVRNDYEKAIMRAALRAAAAKGNLALAIDCRRDLFEKPRSKTVNGVKFGLSKQVGKITADCTDDILAERLIRLFGKKIDPTAFIKKATSVDKNALRTLDETQLKKVGVEIQGDVDLVVVKPAKGNAEKVAEALLETVNGDGG